MSSRASAAIREHGRARRSLGWGVACWLAALTIFLAAWPDAALAQRRGGVVVFDPFPENLVEQSLDDVLSSRDLRHLRSEEHEISERSWELPQWLEDFLEWLFGNSSAGGGLDPGTFNVVRIVLYCVVFVLVFVVVLLIARAIVERGSLGAGGTDDDELNDDANLEAEGPPGERPPGFYLERGEDYAAAGNWRAAVREVLLAAMSWIERRGLIRHRSGITNRGYLRALRRDGRSRGAFARIAGQFEVIFYGRRPASEHRYAACLEAFQEGFRASRDETTSTA